MHKIRNKKIIGDVVINLVSNGLLVIMIQIILLPFLSRNTSSVDFGVILTIYGINNAIGLFLGNSLNNLRLLDSDQNKDSGDYSSLLVKVITAAIIISGVFFYFYGSNLSIAEIIFLIVLSILTVTKNYALVYFRIKIMFNEIFIVNVFCIVGFGIGMTLHNFLNFWPLIFVLSEGLSVIYLYFRTPILKERPQKSSNYKKKRNRYIHLASSNFIPSFLTYLDRLLIAPILGANNVSVYFVASVMGKFVAILAGPMNNVLLTYISRVQNKKARSMFLKSLGISVGIIFIGYIIIILTAPIIINILYPVMADEALRYANVANLATIIMVAGKVLNLFILKFCRISFQTIIQASYAIIYVGGAIVLSINFGLYGFAIAALLANIVRYLLMAFVGLRYIQDFQESIVAV